MDSFARVKIRVGRERDVIRPGLPAADGNRERLSLRADRRFRRPQRGSRRGKRQSERYRAGNDAAVLGSTEHLISLNLEIPRLAARPFTIQVTSRNQGWSAFDASSIAFWELI